jgi:hypothetical protein
VSTSPAVAAHTADQTANVATPPAALSSLPVSPVMASAVVAPSPMPAATRHPFIRPGRGAGGRRSVPRPGGADEDDDVWLGLLGPLGRPGRPGGTGRAGTACLSFTRTRMRDDSERIMKESVELPAAVSDGKTHPPVG